MTSRLEDTLDERTLTRLRERTERLARAAEDHRSEEGLVQIALLQVGPEKVGIPASHLSAIVQTPPITALAGLPAWMPGIVQVRGELLTAIDLAGLLSVKVESPPTSLAIIDHPRGPLGLLATALLGFEDVYPDDIAADFSSARSDGSRPVGGVTRSLISILDLEVLYDNPRLQVALGL